MDSKLLQYKMGLINRLLSGMIFFLIFWACSSSHPYRFNNTLPFIQYNDTLPIGVPKATQYQEFNNSFDVILRKPVVDAFEFSRIEPSKDVNSMDEVPASSWFTPRLGYREITPDELLRGALKYGPPQPPIKIVSGKFAGLTPGFIAEDSRGITYLFKFDPKNFPGIETTSALIVNRLFWGFGYNVPEDYFYYLSENDLFLDPNSNLTKTNLDSILGRVSPTEYGWYRCTVSKFIEGVLLGPFPATGVRGDDPNDFIPHEQRRILRALRVFGAFTNYTDLRLDNTLDVYVGKPGEGYVKHYLVDFGRSLGAFSVDENQLWEGSNHLFSFSDAAKNLITGGLIVQDWEKLKYTPWKSVGVFESIIFRPEKWKESYPFAPIQESQPGDNYWAAKILGALTYEQIEMLVMAANYLEEEAALYVIKTLMERRKKTVEYFLKQVSPIEAYGIINGKLYLKDMLRALVNEQSEDTKYEIRFFNNRLEKISEKLYLSEQQTIFTLEIPDNLFEKANGYLIVNIKSVWGDQPAHRAAQFHIRSDNGEAPMLVGVVH
jgi:hypothetical protein